MRYSEIQEAPIGDFSVRGEDGPASFDAADHRAIMNPKWKTKVFRFFEKFPHRVDVVLLNHDVVRMGSRIGNVNGLQNAISGLPSEEQIARLEDNFGPIPRRSDAITFIMSDNDGDGKFPLTPWMMAHRFIHGCAELLKDSAKAAIDVADYFTPSEQRTAFKFKSAKEGYPLFREGELLVDMLTQYVVQGRLTLNVSEPDIDSLVDRFNQTCEREFSEIVGRTVFVSGKEDTLQAAGLGILFSSLLAGNQ